MDTGLDDRTPSGGPATPLSEPDYEAIEAAVMETARGRWFLAEYARRHRVADTGRVLAAIERLEGLLAARPASPSLAEIEEEVRRLTAPPAEPVAPAPTAFEPAPFEPAEPLAAASAAPVDSLRLSAVEAMHQGPPSDVVWSGWDSLSAASSALAPDERVEVLPVPVPTEDEVVFFVEPDPEELAAAAEPDVDTLTLTTAEIVEPAPPPPPQPVLGTDASFADKERALREDFERFDDPTRGLARSEKLALFA